MVHCVMLPGEGEPIPLGPFPPGFQAVALAPRARLLIGLVVAQTFVRGCLNVLIVLLVFRVFRGGGAEVGYLTAAIGVGGLLGALGAMTERQTLTSSFSNCGVR